MDSYKHIILCSVTIIGCEVVVWKQGTAHNSCTDMHGFLFLPEKMNTVSCHL